MSLLGKLLQLEAEIDKLYNGNQDDPAVRDRIAKLEAEANEIADQIQTAEDAYIKRKQEEEIRRKEEGLKERITAKTGNYLDWMQWAESLYPISETDQGFVVTSTAREWKDGVTWGPYAAKIDAMLKIEELINYKINDRNRGRGDMDEDIGND